MPKTQIRKKTTRSKPRKMPRNLAVLPNKVRTTGTIINQLTVAASRRPQPMSKYMHCRFNPFNAMGATAIPDGSNANFFVNDARMSDTISLSGANREFMIQTLPMLPSLAMIGSTGGTAGQTSLIVSGGAAVKMNSYQPTSLLVAPATAPSYTQISTVQAFVNAMPNPGIGYVDPFASTSARMVSVGYRLTYTGPVTSCAGSIQVTPTSIGLALGPQSTDNLAGAQSGGDTFSFTQLNPPGLSAVAYNVGSQALSCDLTINSSATTRETQVFRPEQTIVILPRHKTKDYKICPTLRRAVVPVVADGGTYASTQVQNIMTAKSGGVTLDGVVWYDEDWESVSIYASGLNADATFRWDTIACFEYNPATTSVFAALTQKASPSAPLDIIKVQQALNNAPVAGPSMVAGTAMDSFIQESLPSSMRGQVPSWRK